MVELSFLADFFIKKIKKRGSLGKRPANFTRCFFLIARVAQLLQRTDTIPSSRVFIRHALHTQTNFEAILAILLIIVVFEN